MHTYDIYLGNGSWFTSGYTGFDHQQVADNLIANDWVKTKPLLKDGDTLIVVRNSSPGQQTVRTFKVQYPQRPKPTAIPVGR